MAIIQTACTSYKAELAQGLHNFTTGTGNVFKIALYLSSATLNADTTVYSSAGEVPTSGTNYTAGGITLTNVTPTFSGTTAYWTFDDAVFTNVTLTTNGALIYNSTNGDRSVCVLNFGQNITKTAANLTVTFPPASATDAILRIE